MKIIKLLCFILAFILAGCGDTSAMLRMARLVENIDEANNLPPAERCEKIRVDLRADCRKKLKKEVEEMSEAMKKHNQK